MNPEYRDKLVKWVGYALAVTITLAANALLTRWLGRPVEIPAPPPVILSAACPCHPPGDRP